MLFRRFENLIDVFKPSPDVAPPAGMLRFYAHDVSPDLSSARL